MPPRWLRSAPIDGARPWLGRLPGQQGASVPARRYLSVPKTRFSWDHGHLSRPVPSRGMPRPGGDLRVTVSADAVERWRRRQCRARHESCPRRIGRRLGLGAPFTRLPAPRGPRPAASARGPSQRRATPKARAGRPSVLGMAITSVVWLAGRPRLREAEDGHLLAAQAVPRPLDAAEPTGSTRPATHRQGAPRSHPEDVGVQSLLGIAAYSERAAEAGPRRSQVHAGEVQGPSPQAAVARVAGVPGQSRG